LPKDEPTDSEAKASTPEIVATGDESGDTKPVQARTTNPEDRSTTTQNNEAEGAAKQSITQSESQGSGQSETGQKNSGEDVTNGATTGELIDSGIPAQENPAEEVDSVAANLAPSENPAPPEESEIQRLTRLLQEQEERWRQTTALLSNLKPAQAPPATGLSIFSGKSAIAALIVIAAVIGIAGGVWYLKPRGGVAVVASSNNQPSIAETHASIAAPPVTSQAMAKPSPASAQIASLPSPVVPSSSQPNSEVPPPESENEVPPPSAPPPTHKKPLSPVNQDLTAGLNDYLHHHHLPYVDAVVYGDAEMVALSGEVRTAKGKQDATLKAEDFLGNEQIRVRNRVSVNPELAASTRISGASFAEPDSGGGEIAPVGGGSCSDLCHKDEGYCVSHCTNQTVGALSSLSSLGNLLGLSSQKKDCDEGCEQTMDHCLASCGSGGGESAGGPESPPAATSRSPAESGGGPDQPPDSGPDQAPDGGPDQPPG
jgi:hypothetical protein